MRRNVPLRAAPPKAEAGAGADADADADTQPAETCPSMDDVRGLYAPVPAPFKTYAGHEHMIIYSSPAIAHATRQLIARSDSVFASVAWATLLPLLYELRRKKRVALVVHAERDVARRADTAVGRAVAHYDALPAFTAWREDGTLDPLFAGTAFEHVRLADGGGNGTVPAARCAGFSKDWSSPKDENNRFMHRKLVIGFRNGAPVGMLTGSANMTHTASISLETACFFVDPHAVRDALDEFSHLYVASGRLDDAPTWHALAQTDFVPLSGERPQIKKRTVGERARCNAALDAELDRLIALGPRQGAGAVPLETRDDTMDAETSGSPERVPAPVPVPEAEPAPPPPPTPLRWLEERAPATPRQELRWFSGYVNRPLSEKAAAWCSERMACTCFSAGRGLGSAQRAIASAVAPQVWVRAGAAMIAASCTRCVESGAVPCAACAPVAAAQRAHAVAADGEARGAASSACYLAMQALLALERRLFVRDDGAEVARPHFRLEVFAFDGAGGETVTTYAWVQTDDVLARAP